MNPRNPIKQYTIPLAKFNPLVKEGVEIVIASTVHNFEGATHVAITTQPRR